MQRFRALSVVLFGVALVIAGCGDSDDSSTDEGAGAAATTTTDGADGTNETTAGSGTENPAGDDEVLASATADGGKPEITIESEAIPTDLVTDDVIVGEGEIAEAGSLLEMHYVGVRYSDGGEFDASWDRGQTFFVSAGAGGVIPGFDRGLIGMAEGGRRILVIPSDQAYGSQGAGGVIGPDETLVFVIDLVQVIGGEAPAVPTDVAAPTELVITDVTEGDGEIVETGDVISVHYQGNLLDGSIFDSSWTRGQPFTTEIGVGRVIPGWDQGMVGMREGGRRILVIPSELGYGSQGSGGGIPPDSPLVFVVDLLRVQG